MTSDKELKLLEVSAIATGLIGIAGLIALLAQGAYAADRGFQPGGRAFTNPFANVPPSGGKPNNFFEEDEEEADFGDNQPVGVIPPPPGGTGTQVGTISAGGQPTEPSDIRRGKGGIEVGGGTAGGVMPGKGELKPIRVDDETGEGSREVVTDFNYPDADIMDIAKTLGKLTGKNFLIDKEVKGRITVISNGPITVGDAWKAFLTALDMNGFALIPSGKYIRIARQRDARDKQLKTYTGDYSPDTDALITRVFPLKYINAEEVARTFRSFMPANSRIIPYEQTNTVIVTDTGSNIAKLNKMLELLDVEGYDAGIEVIPVKYASASELSKLIDTLVPGTSAPGAPAGAPRFGGGGGRFSARRTKEGGIINTIISDERTNTLIVHANTKGADQVRDLVTKLDQKQPAQTGGGKVHVLYLQYADAEQMSNTLNNLSQSAKGAAPVAGGGTGVNPVASSLFEGAIKVSPDKTTNSLVITASPGDFATVQRVIGRLDIPRDQVYVEVVIMEVQIDRGSEFSANVAMPSSLIGSLPNTDLLSFVADPLAKTGLVLPFAAGGSTTVNVGGKSVTVGNVQGLIRAIQTSTKSNVLATPQVIALDNTEATFESAEKIPVPVTTAVQGAGTQTSISKESVALSVKIKPQINKVLNFVKLETEIKIGDINNNSVPSALQGTAFGTLDRSAKTTVVVGDSDTIVIGGLIRDKISESTNKVPILGDIPILGWLFKSKSSSVHKNNLLVFMTPHIVRPYEKVRAILDKKLKERDDFIEAEVGGEDPMRGKRDDMIRSLPDLKKLQTEKALTNVTLDEDAVPAGDAPAVPVNPGSSGPQGGAPLINPATGPAAVANPASVPGGAASLTTPGAFPPPPPPLSGGG